MTAVVHYPLPFSGVVEPRTEKSAYYFEYKVRDDGHKVLFNQHVGSCAVCGWELSAVGYRLWGDALEKIRVGLLCSNYTCGHYEQLRLADIEEHFEPLFVEGADVSDVRFGEGSDQIYPPTWDWARMLIAMHSGITAKCHESIYNYFLDVLPPKWMSGGTFGFAEGSMKPIMFWSISFGGVRHYFMRELSYEEAKKPPVGKYKQQSAGYIEVTDG